ncbi:sigma-54-dependent transcriptional regulator [Undibacterium rugosum]|uniref:Sigma-54-dependent Fis family transcriptional regulator n=1 Tax=Undibacterium rugosum TaxID=2762291 RepID=A0A923HZS2_9BURK|nr:sigma-54-dependent Fis family transcriptional regulator [Undibacterium rugosum]MBR7777768.1 sigma-54-dependent Fis family transcriptional regulator [Undibacterium rugosum]
MLVVDDEAHLRELLEITLIKMGLDVDSAENLSVARSYLQKNTYSLVLTDMRLPDGSGMELVEELSASDKNTPIAVITAFGSADNAVVALKAGAFDYVSKPVALDHLRKLVRSALEMHEVAVAPVSSAHDAGQRAPSFLIGSSAGMQMVRSQIDRLARSMAPVIITGESGSGKELAAREIHKTSARAAQAFVAVNCGAIPENLMEAEFFGYRKGAFTGAVDDRDGFFQAANGGTLMLDEVADLPLAMQVKLLRAIQERRIRKIGSTTEESVDVRIISATHQNLARCVEEGRFRQDLYYRLNVIELHLPPLRQRLEDIPELAQGMLTRLAQTPVSLAPAALQALLQYDFPGNVRELENILERALAFANDGCIEPGDLMLRGTRSEPHAASVSVAAAPTGSGSALDSGTAPATAELLSELALPALPCSLPDFLEQVEREMIRRALQQTYQNRTQAAELLGVSFRQLRYQIQKLKIQ